MTNLMVPNVNRNGDAREELVRQQIAVLDAIHALKIALYQSCPNDRNFQTMDYGSATQAMNEHLRRLEQIEAVEAEVQQLAEAIAG